MDLLVFGTDPDRLRPALAAGAAAVIVDWERRGKARRQAGADTQISVDTVDDLARVRAGLPEARVICRVNPYGPWTARELEAAAAHGADEVLLPMVRGTRDVDPVLDRAECGVGILVETPEAVAAAAALAERPLTRVYVGLNDLAIERGTPTIFAPLADGTLDAVREAVPRSVPLGFGGLTVPSRGAPLPCRLLLAEMARLDARFSFLRRSFWRDAEEIGTEATVRAIRAGAEAARERSDAGAAADRAEVVRLVEELMATAVV